MRKLICAVLAVITVMSVGSVSLPAFAAGNGSGAGVGAGEGQYRDRYDRRDRYERRDRRDRGWWRAHVRRCERAYRSYNRRTDMYRTRSGHWRKCRL